MGGSVGGVRVDGTPTGSGDEHKNLPQENNVINLDSFLIFKVVAINNTEIEVYLILILPLVWVCQRFGGAAADRFLFALVVCPLFC